MSTSAFPASASLGQDYNTSVRSAFHFICLLLPLGSVLVPVILVLLFFSTHESRRRPVFALNLTACASGICLAALVVVNEVGTILHPDKAASQNNFVAIISFSSFSALFVDSILLVRLLALFPRQTTPHRTYLAIMATPVLLKCGRLITIILYINSLAHPTDPRWNMMLTALLTWKRNPYSISKYVLEMADNCYVSFWFIYKLHWFQKATKELGAGRSQNLLARIRSLLLIALGNFIFPIIMNIVQLIFTVCDANFNNGSYVLLSGNYIAILGVVFATIWTDQRSWNNNGTRVEGSKNADPSTWDPAPNRRFRSTITFGTAPHIVPHSIVGAAEDDIPPREKPSTYDVQNRSPSASASEV